MTVAASLVQLLHRTNRQKTDLKGQLARGPKMVAAAKAKLKAAEEHALNERNKLMQARVAADSKQLQMKEREEKIVKLHGKLNAAKENREYQALKDQIAADQQANVVLSDEILELLESIDALVVSQKTAEGRVVEAKGVGLEDGTFFGVGDHPIHSLAVVVFVLCLNIYIYIFGCIK